MSKSDNLVSFTLYSGQHVLHFHLPRVGQHVYRCFLCAQPEGGVVDVGCEAGQHHYHLLGVALVDGGDVDDAIGVAGGDEAEVHPVEVELVQVLAADDDGGLRGDGSVAPAAHGVVDAGDDGQFGGGVRGYVSLFHHIVIFLWVVH